MHKRSLFLALAAAVVACSLGARESRAGTVMVSEAEGTYNFTLMSDGAGHISITYSGVLLTKINDALIPTGSIASTFGAKTVDVTSTTSVPPFTLYTVAETTADKDYGTGAGSISTATLSNTVSTGSAILGFLNLNGSITGVPAPLLETTATSPTVYDFSPFLTGGQIALTYNKVGVDFAAVIAAGGTVSGTGGFTEVASVPEPSSMALLGIGLTGFLTLRRFFKRTTLA
jgi:hypothetical protein